MRLVFAMMMMLALTACGGIRDDLEQTPEPIGNFLLGHNVAVANEPVRGPFSRRAEDEDWKAAMTSAVADRFNNTRYFGDSYYHIGVAVEGYGSRLSRRAFGLLAAVCFDFHGELL